MTISVIIVQAIECQVIKLYNLLFCYLSRKKNAKISQIHVGSPKNVIQEIDLSQAARKEWKKRKELEKCARNEMEPVKPQHQADGSVPFDNFELMNTPIVDVDKLYMDYIGNLIKVSRQRKGPNALNLKEFEINLRRYRIIGGVYALDYCEQPEQNVKLSAKSYLRTSKYIFTQFRSIK